VPSSPDPASPEPAEPTTTSGPAELVERLTRWACETPWVEWLELAGSLGRGAGDEFSDVDAAVGLLDGGDLDAVERAVTELAPTAAMLRQPFGPETTHLVSIYQDGRQLSLVVMPCATRTGLAPEAIALVDKSGRLESSLDRATWDPDAEKLREWTFLACIAASDALKHARRGTCWRALRSLTEGRDLYLQLVAAREHVVFPQFGAVSLENAGVPVPDELAATLVGSPDQQSVVDAVEALVPLLAPFVMEHGLDELCHALRLDVPPRLTP
jgi:predicted nucleotidyltransferase